MLSALLASEEELAPYRSRWILAEPASDPWQRDAYYRLRRDVFVHEQRLFDADDRDEHDLCALPLVAMATSAGVPDEVVGVVRIYPHASGVWYGGRLAVSARYRRTREVGAALIRAAVGSARGLGASRFLATVQEENVSYFERHHFRALEATLVCGRPHRLMEADLTVFTPPHWVLALAREAA